MSSLVSILIPTFNRANLLRRSIESCLSQSYDNKLIFIGNNASTDATTSILGEYANHPEIRIVNRPVNLGATANINDLVLTHSEGDYIVVMSDDDYYVDNDFIAKAVKLLDGHSEAGFVHGEIEFESSDGVLRSNSTRNIPEIIDGRTFFLGFGSPEYGYAYLMTVVVRRALAVSVNIYGDPKIPHGDSLAWLTIATQNSVGFVNSVVARYVMHGANAITSTDASIWVEDIVFIERAFSLACLRTNWPKEELSRWLRRQRHTYCQKTMTMLLGETSWQLVFRSLWKMGRNHEIHKDFANLKYALFLVLRKLKRQILNGVRPE